MTKILLFCTYMCLFFDTNMWLLCHIFASYDKHIYVTYMCHTFHVFVSHICVTYMCHNFHVFVSHICVIELTHICHQYLHIHVIFNTYMSIYMSHMYVQNSNIRVTHTCTFLTYSCHFWQINVTKSHICVKMLLTREDVTGICKFRHKYVT